MSDTCRTAAGGAIGSLQKEYPTKAQRQRVWWGEEEQRNERHLPRSGGGSDMELAPTTRGRNGFDGGVAAGIASGCA